MVALLLLNEFIPGNVGDEEKLETRGDEDSGEPIGDELDSKESDRMLFAGRACDVMIIETEADDNELEGEVEKVD